MAKKKSGLDIQLDLSEDMAEFMGKDRASRSQITKAIWDHIKKNDLQSASNRRNIEPDDALAPILGTKTISMFKIATKISEHVFKD